MKSRLFLTVGKECKYTRDKGPMTKYSEKWQVRSSREILHLSEFSPNISLTSCRVFDMSGGHRCYRISSLRFFPVPQCPESACPLEQSGHESLTEG
ncbi:hypothetical protein CDAR_300551 [Caerostris darwini]|uniref:Uncharacterized protein n=1 Tax=Caerostris darwini TaxID=1538125 RepID=A0AAV4RVJ2_9ARAC|nr:hypothetical protein CDAR_300551 [Caerostris darwini]